MAPSRATSPRQARPPVDGVAPLVRATAPARARPCDWPGHRASSAGGESVASDGRAETDPGPSNALWTDRSRGAIRTPRPDPRQRPQHGVRRARLPGQADHQGQRPAGPPSLNLPVPLSQDHLRPVARLASEATKVETRNVALSRRLGPGLPFGTPTAPASAPSPPSARVVPGPAWAACSAIDYLRSATGTLTHKPTQFP